MCFCSHSDSQNNLMDCRTKKKKKKSAKYSSWLHSCFQQKWHSFAETMEIAGQQQNKTVPFSICLLLCDIPHKTQCLITRSCKYCSWYWGLTWSRLGGSCQSLSGDYSQSVTGEEIIWRLSWAEYLLTHRAEVNSYCYLGTESCLPGCLYSAFLCGFSFSEHAI